MVEVESAVSAPVVGGARPERHGAAFQLCVRDGEVKAPRLDIELNVIAVNCQAQRTPRAASGAMRKTTAPNDVPLILASDMRALSGTPVWSSFLGIGR
jgi:hypothetical protein